MQLATLMGQLEVDDAALADEIRVCSTTIYRTRTGRTRPSGAVLEALNAWARARGYELDWSYLRKPAPAPRGRSRQRERRRKGRGRR